MTQCILLLLRQKNLTLTHHQMIHEVLGKSGVINGEEFEALLEKATKTKLVATAAYFL